MYKIIDDQKKQVARTVTNKTYLRLLYFMEHGTDAADLSSIAEYALNQKRRIRVWLSKDELDFLNQISPPHTFQKGRAPVTFESVAQTLAVPTPYLIDSTAPITPDNIDLSALLAYYIKSNLSSQVIYQTIKQLNADLLQSPVFSFKNIPPQYMSCSDLSAVLAMAIK